MTAWPVHGRITGPIRYRYIPESRRGPRIDRDVDEDRAVRELQAAQRHTGSAYGNDSACREAGSRQKQLLCGSSPRYRGAG